MGFGIELDGATKQLADDVWFGGSPARIMRLTAAGRPAWGELRDGVVSTRAGGVLGRRLTDAGLAHPRPTASGPRSQPSADVTVVLPVRDRTAALGRCLAALGNDYPVVVVDDASVDPAAVAEVVRRHGATLVRRAVNGGPGPARDTGLAQVHTEFVAFIDSDCVPAPDWIARLHGHLADPMVAAVAPRITATAPRTWAGRYTTACGGLDLGALPSRVAPGSRVSYVPTAALLARRSALDAVARDGTVFDPALRVGEDVDLVWRLHAAGWRVRYEPAVQVAHQEPATWADLLERRYRYGTSAADLARRHGAAVAPLVLYPWPSATVAAVLARRPVIAMATLSAAAVSTARELRRRRIPTRGSIAATARAAHQTWLGTGRYLVQLAAPLLAAAACRRSARPAAVSLLLGPAVAAWWPRRHALDPARFVAGWLADQIAYGSGVWVGSVRRRTTVALRPRLVLRPLRFERTA